VTDTKGQEVFEGLLHRRSEMEHGLHKALVTVCLVRFGVLLLANAFNIFFWCTVNTIAYERCWKDVSFVSE